MWILAESTPQIVDLIGSGSSIGTLGVTAWMAWYALTTLKVKLEKLEAAVNNSTKAAILQILTHPRFPEEAKPLAKAILDDIEKK